MQDFDATLYATMRPARDGKSLVTLSTYQERQEALNRTSIMEDDSSHRTSRNLSNGKPSITDAVESQQHAHHQNVPPPPPQFANSPPKNQSNNFYGVQYQTVKRANSTNPTATGITKQPITSAPKTPKPPSSPTPDYDNVDFRKGRTLEMNDATVNGNRVSSSTAASAGNANTSRRTMRLGAVTIGEYEPHRKEPNKLEFVGTKNRDASSAYSNSRNIENLHSELHDTLSRAKLKNGSHVEHQRDCPLRNGYSNGNGVDQLTRKIQGVSLNQKPSQIGEEGTTIKRQSSSGATNGSGGILKNGSSRNSNGNGVNGHTGKMVEKTITFGN